MVGLSTALGIKNSDGDLGGATVASLVVPMVAGIVVEASSSVFIAAPILLLLGERIKQRPAVLQEPKP